MRADGCGVLGPKIEKAVFTVHPLQLGCTFSVMGACSPREIHGPPGFAQGSPSPASCSHGRSALVVRMRPQAIRRSTGLHPVPFPTCSPPCCMLQNGPAAV